MESMIIELYEKIAQICIQYLFMKKRNIVEEVKELLPEIKEFAVWFLESNKLGIEEDIYRYMQQDLLGILKDCIQGVEQRDKVLLHDAIDYGLSEFLKVFLPEEYLERIENEESVEETEDGRND